VALARPGPEAEGHSSNRSAKRMRQVKERRGGEGEGTRLGGGK